MRPLLLLISVALLSTTNGQVDLTALFCHDAIEVCLEGLEFQTVTQADVGHRDYCSPNSLIHNPRYLVFTPEASTIDITVANTGCTSGSALQYAILDTCDWTNDNVIACDPYFDGISNQTVNDLIVGKKYYLMVEGANAATCGFRVSITNITGGTYPGELGALIGTDVFTPGQTLELSLPDAVQDQYYVWSIPWLGDPVVTDMAYLNIMIPEDAPGGQQEICVSPAAGCNLQACITVLMNQVEPDLTTLTCQEAVEFCPHDLVFQTRLLPDVGHAGFCGPNTLIHNPRYLLFTPIDSTVHLTINITDCSTGTALQYAVVDTCDWINADVVACDPGFTIETSRTMSELSPGKSYYLVVDGSNAATCGYTISLTSITGGQYTGILDTIIVVDSLPGENTVHFNLGPNAMQDASYVWDISWLNSPLTTDTAFLTIEPPCALRAVERTICVRPVIGCMEPVCIVDSFEPVHFVLPSGDTMVTIILPRDNDTMLLATDLFSAPPGCSNDIQISFNREKDIPARVFDCAELQMNGGPYFLDDIWISDGFGHEISIPVTFIVRDTFGHCLPADVPSDTLQIDTTGFKQSNGPGQGLTTSPAFAVQWSPNPWHHETHARIATDIDTRGSLIIYNCMGQIVFQQVLDMHAGINTISLEADQCNASGLLIYEIRLGTKIQTGRLIATK